MNFIYKVVDHYYKTAKRYKAFYLVIQLTMLLPLLKELTDTVNEAVSSFIKGIPIGDSAGPLVAYNVLSQCSAVKYYHDVKDTVVAECDYQGRRVYVVKARGPGSTVGRLDEAVEYVFNTLKATPKYIITVDAALRLEGEKTGEVAEGVGVAMGYIYERGRWLSYDKEGRLRPLSEEDLEKLKKLARRLATLPRYAVLEQLLKAIASAKLKISA